MYKLLLGTKIGKGRLAFGKGKRQIREFGKRVWVYKKRATEEI
jgi:hypothetical protein